jgi:D-arabinose 1-dehydrogenase-like Zn-dependent alcohol dehydrogenase
MEMRGGNSMTINSQDSKKSGSARAVQVSGPGAPLEVVTRDIPVAKRGQVRLRVQACGICHSDSMAKEGHWPGVVYPIVPGHEVVGLVDSLGEGVTGWLIGQRVGVGWYGGHCGVCEACRRGDFVLCARPSIPGLTYDGGYADYMTAPAEALAAIPDSLTSVDAAPLLCAGITTFNALRNSEARAGDLVAILGMGGLGHLGVQFAAKMGFRTVAIARGQEKAKTAHELGAHHYIDSLTQDVAKSLADLGGAKLILATVTNADAMTAALGGLGYRGTLLIVGASPEPLKVSPIQLIMQRRSIQGWASGTSIDSEDTLKFSAMSGVRPLIERYPLERAAGAYDRMMSGAARFRVVLETGA